MLFLKLLRSLSIVLTARFYVKIKFLLITLCARENLFLVSCDAGLAWSKADLIGYGVFLVNRHFVRIPGQFENLSSEEQPRVYTTVRQIATLWEAAWPSG